MAKQHGDSPEEEWQSRICIDPHDLNEAVLREHHPMSSIEDIASRLQDSAV